MHLEYNLMIFGIAVVSVLISPLTFLVLFSWVLSLFLLSLDKMTSTLFVFKKKKGLSFIDLFYYFVTSLIFISALILLFHSLCWLRILFFLFKIILDGRLGCLSHIFLVSWGSPVSMNFALRNTFASSYRFQKVGFSFSLVSKYFLWEELSCMSSYSTTFGISSIT